MLKTYQNIEKLFAFFADKTFVFWRLLLLALTILIAFSKSLFAFEINPDEITSGGALFVIKSSANIGQENGEELSFTNNNIESTKKITQGGAIYFKDCGDINFYGKVNFEDNSVSGIGVSDNQGGALYIVGAGAVSFVGDVSFNRNIAASNGGAVLIQSVDSVSVYGEIIATYNYALGQSDDTGGGGVFDVSDVETITFANSSDFLATHNRAYVGGAFSFDDISAISFGGVMDLNNNVAGTFGGAVYISSCKEVSFSGGLYDNSGEILKYGLVVSQNVAYAGAGLFFYGENLEEDFNVFFNGSFLGRENIVNVGPSIYKEVGGGAFAFIAKNSIKKMNVSFLENSYMKLSENTVNANFDSNLSGGAGGLFNSYLAEINVYFLENSYTYLSENDIIGNSYLFANGGGLAFQANPGTMNAQFDSGSVLVAVGNTVMLDNSRHRGAGGGGLAFASRDYNSNPANEAYMDIVMNGIMYIGVDEKGVVNGNFVNSYSYANSEGGLTSGGGSGGGILISDQYSIMTLTHNGVMTLMGNTARWGGAIGSSTGGFIVSKFYFGGTMYIGRNAEGVVFGNVATIGNVEAGSAFFLEAASWGLPRELEFSGNIYIEGNKGLDVLHVSSYYRDAGPDKIIFSGNISFKDNEGSSIKIDGDGGACTITTDGRIYADNAVSFDFYAVEEFIFDIYGEIHINVNFKEGDAIYYQTSAFAVYANMTGTRTNVTFYENSYLNILNSGINGARFVLGTTGQLNFNGKVDIKKSKSVGLILSRCGLVNIGGIMNISENYNGGMQLNSSGEINFIGEVNILNNQFLTGLYVSGGGGVSVSETSNVNFAPDSTVLIEGNYSYRYGGGIYIDAISTEIIINIYDKSDVTIKDNTSKYNGAGMLVAGQYKTAYFNIFSPLPEFKLINNDIYIPDNLSGHVRGNEVCSIDGGAGSYDVCKDIENYYNN